MACDYCVFSVVFVNFKVHWNTMILTKVVSLSQAFQGEDAAEKQKRKDKVEAPSKQSASSKASSRAFGILSVSLLISSIH